MHIKEIGWLGFNAELLYPLHQWVVLIAMNPSSPISTGRSFQTRLVHVLPPMRSRPSRMVTLCPASWSARAALSPEMPAPRPELAMASAHEQASSPTVESAKSRCCWQLSIILRNHDDLNYPAAMSWFPLPFRHYIVYLYRIRPRPSFVKHSRLILNVYA